MYAPSVQYAYPNPFPRRCIRETENKFVACCIPQTLTICSLHIPGQAPLDNLLECTSLKGLSRKPVERLTL
jgi:hypothetical protein